MVKLKGTYLCRICQAITSKAKGKAGTVSCGWEKSRVLVTTTYDGSVHYFNARTEVSIRRTTLKLHMKHCRCSMRQHDKMPLISNSLP